MALLPYWEPIRDDQTNYTYSIDNIVVWFRLYYPEDVLCQEILDFISNRLDFDYDHFQSFKFACFRDQFSFRLGDGYSFWLGASFNGAKGTADPFVALDFNPNKVMRFQHFAEIYNFVLARSKQVDFKRFDLAIDIPVKRSDVFMYKGRRKLTVDPDEEEELFIGNSWENFTHYLGRRSSVGRVKLYNKQRESNLNYPLTRVELTCAPDSDMDKYMPTVKYFDDLQMVFNDLKISGSDRLILRRVLEHPDELGELSYYQRKRFDDILEHYTKTVEVNKGIYDNILMKLFSFRNMIDLSGYEKLPFNNGFSEKVEIEEFNMDELVV